MKTSGDSNPELSFEGFKAGRSQLKQPLPTSPASKPVDNDQVVRDSGSELEMRSGYSGVKNNDKNHEMQPNLVKLKCGGPCQKTLMTTPPVKAILAVIWRPKLLKFPKGYSRELILPFELRIWGSQLRKEMNVSWRINFN